MADRHIFSQLHEALKERSPAVLLTVVESPDPLVLGAKALLIIEADQVVKSASTLPSDWADAVTRLALDRWRASVRESVAGEGTDRARRPKRVTIESFTHVPGVKMSVEIFRPRPRMVIAGGGHIALPTHQIGAIVGFAVTVLDDRPAFASKARFPEAEQVICDDFTSGIRKSAIDANTSVVVVTRGHLHDLEVLKALAGTSPAYVGMIGSRRRTLTVLERLEADGFPDAFIEKIYSPIGLDIGAETPQEIALAIVSEVVCVLRGGRGTHLRQSLRRFRPQ